MVNRGKKKGGPPNSGGHQNSTTNGTANYTNNRDRQRKQMNGHTRPPTTERRESSQENGVVVISGRESDRDSISSSQTPQITPRKRAPAKNLKERDVQRRDRASSPISIEQSPQEAELLADERASDIAIMSPMQALSVSSMDCSVPPYDVPPQMCNSSTQTDSVSSDCLLHFLSLSAWDQLETLCELVKCLGAYELRLLGSMVEGAARAQYTMLRQHEIRANSPSFISGITNSFRLTYAQTAECAYSLVSLLSSTNRVAAFAFVKLMDVLMTDRMEQLAQLSNEEQQGVLSTLGRIATVCMHHPVFSVDQRLRMETARDELRIQFDRLQVGTSSNDNNRAERTHNAFTFVQRFTATQPDATDENHFLIQMLWNDGMRTFVPRTRNEILLLHHKLLDLFGEERCGERGGKQGRGGAGDDCGRDASPSPFSSNSPTPTPSSVPSEMPSTIAGGAMRILPYLSNEATSAMLIEYVNRLSDLPARMMLSEAIYSEFYASRFESCTESREMDGVGTHGSSISLSSGCLSPDFEKMSLRTRSTEAINAGHGSLGGGTSQRAQLGPLTSVNVNPEPFIPFTYGPYVGQQYEKSLSNGCLSTLPRKEEDRSQGNEKLSDPTSCQMYKGQQQRLASTPISYGDSVFPEPWSRPRSMSDNIRPSAAATASFGRMRLNSANAVAPPTSKYHQPTCSNCAGDHPFVYCDKKNIMDFVSTSKDGYRLNIAPLDESQQLPQQQTNSSSSGGSRRTPETPIPVSTHAPPSSTMGGPNRQQQQQQPHITHRPPPGLGLQPMHTIPPMALMGPAEMQAATSGAFNYYQAPNGMFVMGAMHPGQMMFPMNLPPPMTHTMAQQHHHNGNTM